MFPPEQALNLEQVERCLFSVPQYWFDGARKFLDDHPLPSSNHSGEDGANDLRPLSITEAKKDEFETFLKALAAQ